MLDTICKILKVQLVLKHNYYDLQYNRSEFRSESRDESETTFFVAPTILRLACTVLRTFC